MSTPDKDSPAAIAAAWGAKQDAYNRLNAELFTHNKAALFEALAAASITSVVVNFDGYGDEGQIQNIEIEAAEQVSTLPDVQIEITCPVWDKAAPERSNVGLSAAIEHLVCLLLEKTHCGWQNNDGAYGDFIFDVPARTITLDYNERYTSSENFQHVF
jgi:hypothetical protein